MKAISNYCMRCEMPFPVERAYCPYCGELTRFVTAEIRTPSLSINDIKEYLDGNKEESSNARQEQSNEESKQESTSEERKVTMSVATEPDPYGAIEYAGKLYEHYCRAVGGVAFNGDKLPSWEQFSRDPAKDAQARAWVAVAELVMEEDL